MKTKSIALFLKHVDKLIPDEKDQVILLSYMAAVIQHPAAKFNWAPVIQGVQGNGKSILLEQLVRASRLKSPSNTIQPIHRLPKGALRIPVRFMGVEFNRAYDKAKVLITHNPSCNFMFLTNNTKIKLSELKDDRRLSIFITAQQSVSDLERDGLTTAYFSELHEWLHVEGGARIVQEYLRDFVILEEHNPVMGGRAPSTRFK